MKYIYIILVALMPLYVTAQVTENTKEENFFIHNMDYQVRAQFSIGGSSPLGLPREIRKIDSYNPTLQLGLEANATKWLTVDQKWGVRIGLRFEGKGMKTKAEVKDYKTRIFYEGTELNGYYDGKVRTNVRNTYITFPISAVYRITPKWNIYGGVYLSGLIDKNFDGYVYDGTFRKDSPVGDRINFKDEERGEYDFSDEVRKFQWGAQIGGEWTLNKNFKLFSDLTYGFNGVLRSDFDAISFSMHNIYLNLGFGYQF
ncbi:MULTISPECIES: porin family protein [Myroides]|uniref:Outer membrane beta-barrel protein n=1 Tax=Myroides albus TaxID=2562892 RepID=A0A6I3LEH0_9FLAO|nr:MULTISPECIES: porin family protein [Myroides]MTG96613.1 outer membrane beta-barrel protein [Myroides albus]MVX34609.1 outer membrane beta-barrel protein [Myroides sp. LoEW2-1]UVD80974.1 PorT family protein [Myroides albus]